MEGDSIGLFDVNTNRSLAIDRYVDLGIDRYGASLGLAYTRASHGRLVQIRAGCLRCTYDVDGDMLSEDADRIGRWLDMDGCAAVELIRERSIS